MKRELRVTLDDVAYASADSDPTAADVLAHLAQDPALYLAVLDGAKLARPWDTRFPRCGQPFVYTESVRHDARGCRPMPAARCWVGGPGQRWHLEVLGEAIPGFYETFEEARADGDRLLTAAEWTLMGAP